MPPTPSTPTTAQAEIVTQLSPWEYGVLGSIALVFALTIIYLFRYYTRRERRWELERNKFLDERKGWDIERVATKGAAELAATNLRAEYEEKHRETCEAHIAQLAAERDRAREREDQIRRDFAAITEGLEREYTKSSESIIKVLDKFYDRFVGPRGRY